MQSTTTPTEAPMPTTIHPSRRKAIVRRFRTGETVYSLADRFDTTVTDVAQVLADAGYDKNADVARTLGTAKQLDAALAASQPTPNEKESTVATAIANGALDTLPTEEIDAAVAELKASPAKPIRLTAKTRNAITEALTTGASVEQVAKDCGVTVAKVKEQQAKLVEAAGADAAVKAEQAEAKQADREAAKQAKAEQVAAKNAERDQRRAQIIELRNAGKKLGEIGEVVGLSPTRVQRILSDAGLSNQGANTGPRDPERDTRLVEVYTEATTRENDPQTSGQAISTISEAEGLSGGRVRQILKRGGVVLSSAERLGGSAPKPGSDDWQAFVDSVRELEGRWSVAIGTIAHAMFAARKAGQL